MTHLITTYGYFAVALLVGLESLGIPLPGETILVAAEVYAGPTHRLSVWVLFAVAAAYYPGDAFSSAETTITVAVAAAAAVAIAAMIVLVRRQYRKLTVTAEAALQGPLT